MSKKRFCASKTGFYWLHFDSVTDDHLNINYSLISDAENFLTGIVKTGSNKTAVDVFSQNFIIETDSVTCLQMTSLFGTFSFSSSLYAMTWAGFLIDSKIVFSLSTDIPQTSYLMPANFSIIFLNAGKLI